MQEERRRKSEARTGTLTFVAGLWLIMAPPLLDFQAERQLFRPYWVPLVLGVAIMLAGMLRALAPLEVPWARTINIGLAAALVAAAFVVRADVSPVVEINQIVVGAVIALMSLVTAVDSGKWLG